MTLFGSAAASFLVALPALLSIVNPLGGALIYYRVTADRTERDRVALAWRVAAYSAMVMLTALWIGASLMNFFGVSLDALRIAGGLVVAVTAWEMLSTSKQKERETHKEEQAVATDGSSDDVAFFPLTMPFTTGPGTISVAIALSASRPSTAVELVPFFVGLSAAAVVVAILVGLCYASAERVVALMGPGRARVLTRLSAFLLLCIGVQIFLTGTQHALATVLNNSRLTP